MHEDGKGAGGVQMTDEELATIAARAKDATPGPWVALHDTTGSIVTSDGEVIVQGDVAACGVLDVSDQPFIAHAREDVPRLLAEVERLREQNKQQSIYLDGLMSEQTKNKDIVRALEAQNAAWREIGQTVAAYADNLPPHHLVQCAHCKAYVLQHLEHKAECPVTRARALLQEAQQ